MWREINKYYFWLLWFLSFIAGIALYCIIFFPAVRRYCFELFSRKIPSYTLGFELGATILMIGILVILWVEFRKMKLHRHMLDFIAADSHASIPQKTINRFISSAIRSFPTVNQVAVQSSISQESLDVIVQLKVTDEVALSTLINEIQQRVRERVKETFGHDIIADFTIEITDIVSTPSGLLSHTSHAISPPESQTLPASENVPSVNSEPEHGNQPADSTDDRDDDDRSMRFDND